MRKLSTSEPCEPVPSGEASTINTDFEDNAESENGAAYIASKP
jgi:hypothetical protein